MLNHVIEYLKVIIIPLYETLPPITVSKKHRVCLMTPYPSHTLGDIPRALVLPLWVQNSDRTDAI